MALIEPLELTTDELDALLVQRRLPRWAPVLSVALALALAVVLNITTDVSGVAGTVLVAVALFVTILTSWSFAVEGRRYAVDRLATTGLYACMVLALTPLTWILITLVLKGVTALSAEFLTSTMRNVSPRKPGGGIGHAIVGTIEQVGIASAIGIPIGILAAIYLVEYGNRRRLARTVSFFVDVMTGIPSIVAGLFVYVGLILTLGLERSGFAGAVALCILMIPVVVRSSEEMLKLVPMELREASYALGVAKYLTIIRVVLPTALPGIVSGSMLAVARITGETAPLLLTTFLAQSWNANPFEGPQTSLATYIWDQISNGTTASVDRAWAAALVLVLFVMLLNLGARLVAWASRVR